MTSDLQAASPDIIARDHARAMAAALESYDEAIVFDADAWNGEDVGDNSQFYRRATIIHTAGSTEPWASVEFEDGRVSHGHIISHMRPVEPS